MNDKLRSVCGKKQTWAGASLVGMMKAKKLEVQETDEKGGSIYIRTLLVSNIIHHTWQINYISIRSNGGISPAERN